MSEASDELTTRFAEALFARFPDWRQYARAIPESSGNVAVAIEVPQEGTSRTLYLETTEGEITIGFDQWHTNVGAWLGINLEESVVTAMNIIEGFLREETVVVVLERNGVWAGSELEYRVAPGPRTNEVTTKVLSWKRTYDDTKEPN